MSARHFLSYSFRMLLPALILVLHVPFSTLAADGMEDLIPPDSCGTLWKIEGKALFYDRDTLSDRIDGEAELYFPYGFDRLAAARYASGKSPGTGMDVEIFRMGSLLDAFGMYANYRQRDSQALPIGAESNLSASQLFFYQGRHFIHIQITGTEDANMDALAECGRAVASRMPGNKSRPTELSVIDRPEVVKGTERYLPQSLLGYDFLNKGIIADAVVEGASLQIFLLLGTTAQSASAAFDHYRSQLVQGKIDPVGDSTSFLEGVDPLYGPVMILKRGKCLAGALKFNGKKGIRVLLESVCR